MTKTKQNSKKTALIIPRLILMSLFNLAPQGEGQLNKKMAERYSKRNARLKELFYPLQIFTESKGLRNRPFRSAG